MFKSIIENTDFVIKQFLLICSLILITLSSLAGSVLGGEITYRNLNADTVIVRMVLYRDCSQSQLDSVQKIVFTTIGCSTNKSDTARIKRRTISSADLLCSSVTSVCSGGSFSRGIQEHEYIDTFNLQQVFNGGLSASCCNLRISFSYGSRAYTTNITGGYPFYIETTMNRCVVNKSVTFFNKPFFTIRAGASFQYTNGAMEQDGDSLVYELTQPESAANNNIPYVNGFGSYFPIVFNFLGFPSHYLPCPAGIHYNKDFDNFDFTAMGGQNPTLNYRISEWRNVNGVMTKISSVLRDFTFSSDSYALNLFPAFGLVQMFTAPWCYVPFPPDNECNSNSEKYFHVTVGQRICFWVVAADTAAGDTTSITWNGGLPGASFASANQNGNVKQSDTAFICWTPTINQYRKEPYFFALTLTDKACPIRNRISRNQLITVGPAYFPRSIFRNGNGNYTFRMDYLSEVTNPSISWRLSLNRFGVFDTSNSVSYSGNPVNHTFTQNGKYILRSTIQSGLTGIATFYDTITVCDFAPVAQVGSDTSLCKNNFIKLAASPSGGVWSGTILQHDTFNAMAAGNFTLVYTITPDTFGCAPLKPADTLQITVYNPPLVTSTTDTVLCEQAGFVPLQASPPGGTWTAWGLGMNGNLFNGNQNPGSYQAFYSYTDSNGCSTIDTTKIAIIHAAFTPSVSSGFVPLFVTFSNTSDSLYSHWLWNFGNGTSDTSSLKNPSYTFTMSNRWYSISLTASSAAYHCATTVYGNVSTSANSNDHSSVSPVTVYPNPVADMIFIDRGNFIGTLSVRLTDLAGKVLKEICSSEKVIELPIDDLSKGIYLLDISGSPGEHNIQKLVVE